MDHNQFGSLVKGGKVHLEGMTEKTDGQTHQFGYDEHGFYTQSSGSGSERMRTPKDFEDRATRRSQETGKPLDLTAAHAFGHIHSTLQNNQKLQDHLKREYQRTGKEVTVKGEVFYRPWGRPGDRDGETKFVHTSYATSHMGKVGKYVIHSKLPQNQGHDIEHFKKNLSTPEMNFDDDKLEHPAHHIDVSHEEKEFSKLDHGLMGQRTSKSNKEAKEAEIGKMQAIQKKVADKVDSHIKSMNLSKKWGSGSEGIVVHPTGKNPEAPRFKVTSDTFKHAKSTTDFSSIKRSPT